jgi:pimeloyl-ACP methyl ester carboxylesterase
MNQTAASPKAPREEPATPPMPEVTGVSHRFVQTSRLRVHVAESGAGRPVVLLHGAFQHWYAWREVIPALATCYRVICPDLRGHGWTEVSRSGYGTAELVSDVLALLDTLGLERVALAGHDVGGRVGFHLGLSAPDRVGRLLALGTLHPFWSFRELAPQAWRYWWTPLVETSLVGRVMVRHVPALTRTVLRAGRRGQVARDDRAVGHFTAIAREPGHARACEALMHEFAYHEIIPNLLGRYRSCRLTVPTLMLNGTRDPFVPAAALGGGQGHADDLRIRRVEDAGHYLPEEQPAIVAAAAAEFFGTC